MWSDILTASPLLAMVVLSLVVLLIEAMVKKGEVVSYWISVAGLALSAYLAFGSIPHPQVLFNEMLASGGLGGFFSTLFILSALLTIILSREYISKEHENFGEFYLLILFATIGMMLMAMAADLIIIFLGLELMSICLYVLAGFIRNRPISNEASLKYFLLGAFATGFLLYGIALIYGASGTTHIQPLVLNFGAISSSPFFWVGIGLLAIGLSFKVGAVPFHMWIPDVYQGSPTPISGFMSTGAKAAAFSAFVIVFAHHFDNADRLRLALAVLSAASMIVGNIIAITQSNIKRMLAYSSIAHAGYMMAGLAAGNELGRDGIVFYLAVYTFMNIGAFGILGLLEQEGEKNLEYSDYAGLGARRPLLAATMSAFMLSLAGIPPFAGFLGKYYVFVAAVNAHLTWLAIIGVLTSLVSVYYYLRLVMVMYFQEGDNPLVDRPSRVGIAVVLVSAVIILGLGIFPSSILSIINHL
ncbi:MAG TPA: NADH-quinone oxidoreductase subunit N [Bacteroidota bacterium]|nr:NADH-quinone oxidoreductase subunit N [Bacteroidota bacterium]